jgi:hypothetical protein
VTRTLKVGSRSPLMDFRLSRGVAHSLETNREAG